MHTQIFTLSYGNTSDHHPLLDRHLGLVLTGGYYHDLEHYHDFVVEIIFFFLRMISTAKS